MAPFGSLVAVCATCREGYRGSLSFILNNYLSNKMYTRRKISPVKVPNLMDLPCAEKHVGTVLTGRQLLARRVAFTKYPKVVGRK